MKKFFFPRTPPPRPKWVLRLVAGGLLVIPTTVYFTEQRRQPKSDVINSLTVPVTSQDITVRISASGTVQPVQRVNLSPKNSGRIAELYVEQGDRVKQGQLIARMESRDLEAQLMQSRARMASAEARLAKLKAGNRQEQIDQARSRLEQIQAQLDQLRAGSRSEEISQVGAQLAQAQARLAQLRAGNRVEEVAQGEARLRQAQTRLNDAKTGTMTDEIAQAQAQLESAKAEADLQFQRLERNRDLVQQGAISQDQFAEIEKDNRTGQARLEETQQRLQQLKKNRLSQIAQLEQAVEQERQSLKQLRQSRPEEILRGEAEVAEVKAKLEQMLKGARWQEISKMEAAVAEAQSKLDELLNGSRPEEIAQAQAELAEAQAQVRYSEVRLEDTRVRAPFDGMITQRSIIVGDFVNPANFNLESEMLLPSSRHLINSPAGEEEMSLSRKDLPSSLENHSTIVVLARDLEVLAKIPESDILQIKPSQVVEIVADAYPDILFRGVVRLIAPEAIKERDFTLFHAHVEIVTGKVQLQSGMTVNLKFLGKQLKGALVVPREAIFVHRGKLGVFIPGQNNRPKFLRVVTGVEMGENTQILSGLKLGERVFIELPESQNPQGWLSNPWFDRLSQRLERSLDRLKR